MNALLIRQSGGYCRIIGGIVRLESNQKGISIMVNIFEEGSVVRLKSGGPKMTVENSDTGEAGQDTYVRCVWISPAEILNTKVFREKMLNLVDDDT